MKKTIRMMPDLTKARKSLQLALDRKTVVLHDCEIHPDIKVIADVPAPNEPRITYVNERDGKVLAIAVFGNAEPLDGLPCFQLGYAVAEFMRQQGLATDIVQKGLVEFKNGMKRKGFSNFYIEAIVGTSNVPSNKLARRLISDTPTEDADNVSGEPIMQYIILIET